MRKVDAEREPTVGMDPPNMDVFPYRFVDHWSIFFTDIEGSYQEEKEKTYDEWMWDEIEPPSMPASFMLAKLKAQMDDLDVYLDAVEEDVHNFCHTEAITHSELHITDGEDMRSGQRLSITKKESFKVTSKPNCIDLVLIVLGCCDGILNFGTILTRNNVWPVGTLGMTALTDQDRGRPPECQSSYDTDKHIAHISADETDKPFEDEHEDADGAYE